MQKPDLPQNPSRAHPTHRDASTEPAELEIIVPSNLPVLTPAAARALMHLLTELATRSLQPNPAATEVDPHHDHAARPDIADNGNQPSLRPRAGSG